MSGPLGALAALAHPSLAAVGDVGEGFFKERTEANLPCQASESHLFCWDWATEHIDRYGTPTLEQLSRAAEDSGLAIRRVRELVADGSPATDRATRSTR